MEQVRDRLGSTWLPTGWGSQLCHFLKVDGSLDVREGRPRLLACDLSRWVKTDMKLRNARLSWGIKGSKLFRKVGTDLGREAEWST